MKEKCVICNEEFDYDINDDINIRDFYVEGVGQCCAQCYYETFRLGINDKKTNEGIY